MGVFDKINKSDASPSSGGGVFGKIKKTNDYNNARGASETDEQYQYAHQWDNSPEAQAIINPLQAPQSSFADRAQGFNAPDENGNFRTNFPGGIFNPLNDLNRLNNSPLLRSFNRGAGSTMGVPDAMMDPMKTSYVPSMDSFNRQSAANLPENNRTLGEKIAGFGGSTAGFLVNPAMPAGNLSPVSNFFENPKLQQISNALGNKAQGLIGSKGMAVGMGLNEEGTKIVPQIIDSLLGKSLNKAVTGTTRNALGMAAYSPFHTLMAGQDVHDIPDNMLNDTLAGAAFGPLEGLGPALGKGLGALKGLKGEVPAISNDVFNQATGAKIQRATGGMSDSIGQNAANHFTHNLPENVQARAESSLESYKLAMESKYNPSNQNINVWDKMTNKEKGQMNQLTKAIGAESPKTVKQEPPVIEQNAPKSTFNVGEEAIPTTADGADLSGPKKIIDVQNKDGVNYYRFEGDNSYLPDNMVRRAEETTPPIPNERSNYKNQRENGNFSEDFNTAQAKRDTTYEPITNKETVDAVNEEFTKRSVPDIEAEFLSNNELSAKHTGIGYRLIQKLDQAAQKATTQYEKEMYINKAVHVADKLAADLTRAGQTTQAASILKRLSPEGQLIQLNNKAKASGKTVKPEDAAKFMELARERQSTMSSGPETAQFYDLLDRIKAGEKVTTDELQSSVEKLLSEAQTAKPEKAPKEVKPRVRDKVLSYLEIEAEKAKKELGIKNNLGFARQAGTPDIVLWSKVMAHELAKKAVTLADFTELLVKQAGESIRPHAQAIYDGAKSLIGKADRKIGPDKAKLIEKFLKEGNFKPEDEKALRGIADEINKLKGKKGVEADMQMQKILNSYEKSSPWGMLQTLRFMAMLGNEATQSLNALSGPLMMTYRHMLDIFLTPFDAALSKVIKGRERQVTFKQGAGVFDDVFTPMVDWFKGLGTGAKAGWHGVDPEGITSQHDIRGLSFKGKYNPLGWGERTLGAVAKSPDYATFNATRNMELRKMAYLDALNKGVKGKDAIQAHMDKFIADPPQQALEASARQGKKTTFQYGDGIAKRAARWGKPLTAAVPFIKTPTNIAITGLENTPAGILKGIFELYQLNKGIDGLYPKEGITQKEIMQTFGSSVTGTFALGGLGYVLGKLGIITGDYDTNNSNVQAVKEASGEGKFKFNRTAFDRMFQALFSGDMDKIKDVSKYRDGDYQLDYNRLQPLAMPVAMGATFEQGKDKPMGERLANTAKSTGASLFGMSALKGITDIGNLPADVKGSDVPLGFINNIAEGYAKSFSPSAPAAEARRQDPIQRDTSYHKGFKEDVGSYYKSRIPESLGFLGLGTSKDLTQKITNMGDVKQNLDPYLNTLKAEKTQFNQAARIINDVIKKTGDETLAPGALDKTVKGIKRGEKEQSTVAIDPKRYDKLTMDVGQEFSKKVIALPESKRTAKEIDKAYAAAKEKYWNPLRRELGFKTD